MYEDEGRLVMLATVTPLFNPEDVQTLSCAICFKVTHF